MGNALQEATPCSTAWSGLPARVRVLYVTSPSRTGGWLAEAFAADSAVVVRLDEAAGAGAGMSRLREDAFDAVLVSHEPGELDALEFAQALRASGSEDPLVILGSQNDAEMAALCYEVGADAYVNAHATTTRALIWVVARAVERHQMRRDLRRLTQSERRRLKCEHQEAQHLLEEQRSLLRDLEALGQRQSEAPGLQSALEPLPGADGAATLDEQPILPAVLLHHYQELLRAYVIMGSGNLTADMGRLADLLASAGISAPQTMQLHLHVLEEMVRGLGNRSARHVMTRADLLALEVMVHLTEAYRRKYNERRQPPRQLCLPGLE